MLWRHWVWLHWPALRLEVWCTVCETIHETSYSLQEALWVTCAVHCCALVQDRVAGHKTWLCMYYKYNYSIGQNFTASLTDTTRTGFSKLSSSSSLRDFNSLSHISSTRYCRSPPHLATIKYSHNVRHNSLDAICFLDPSPEVSREECMVLQSSWDSTVSWPCTSSSWLHLNH